MMLTDESGIKTDATAGSSFEYTPPIKIEDVAKELINKPTAVLDRLTNLLSEGIAMVGKAVLDLDAKSAALVKTLGVSSQRIPEFTETIASAIPRFLELGMDAKDATETYTDVINSFNTNMSLGDEQLVELAATAEFTGQKAGAMSKAFMDVGIPISQIGERMVEVSQIANQAGVTVGKVAAGVVENLDKMNLYNFEGGVKGLAKMAAITSKFGMDMKSVFSIVDKVFDPEGAINLAASLQRLGVQTSAMLDPLKLMDLAQNDPTELTNQIIGMTKQFTRFNETTKQFEIMPGAKRQMNEIAKELGYTAGEFQKMALNAANFDLKLKQIKFSPDVKEEDRELVATMAQINEQGEAVVQIERKDTLTGEGLGIFDTVKTSALSADQVKQLAEQQKQQGKTAEQIANDQLSQLKKVNGSIDRFLSSVAYGVAGSKPTQELYKTTMQGAKGFVELGKGVTTESMSLNIKEVTENVQKLFKEGWEVYENSGLKTLLEEGSKYIKKLYGSLPDFGDIFGTTTTKSTASIVGLSETEMTNMALKASTTTTPSTVASKTLPEKVELTHVFDFTKAPASMTSAEVTTILQNWASNPINANAIVMAAQKINSGLIA